MAYNREIFGIGRLKSTRKNEKPYYKGIIDTGYTKYSFTCYPSADGETMKVSLFRWAKRTGSYRRSYNRSWNKSNTPF
jgi:hypothetical protein